MKYVFRPKWINDLASGKITRYYNTGLIYKTLAQTEGAQKEAFAALYEAWIRRVKGVDDAKRRYYNVLALRSVNRKKAETP